MKVKPNTEWLRCGGLLERDHTESIFFLLYLTSDTCLPRRHSVEFCLPNVFPIPVILLNKTHVAGCPKEEFPSYRTLKTKPTHESQMRNYKYSDDVEGLQGRRGHQKGAERAAIKPLIG